MNKAILILALLLFMFDSSNAQNEDIFSYSNRLAFANYLFSENDFLRALEEYSAIQEIKNNDTVQFKIALSFYNLKRTNEAKDYLKSLFFNSSLNNEARIFNCVVNFKENKFKITNNELELYLYENNKFKSTYNQMKAFSSIYYDEKSDSNIIDNFENKFKLPLKSFIERKNNFEFKSPVKAAVLSGILPGLGKVYAGNYSDGITTFIYIAALGYLSYTSFDHKHEFRGYLFGGLATYFYAGNIYGSYDAAFQYNQKIKFNFRQDLESFIESVNYFLPDWSFLK